MQPSTGWDLILIGLILLAGSLGYMLAPRLHLPRVTFLIIAGFLSGPSFLGFIPAQVSNWFPLVAHLSLAMVGFLVGSRFSGEREPQRRHLVLGVSLAETAAAALFVGAGLLLIGAPLPVALLLAGIAPVSSPAAVFETMRQSRAKGPLSDTVLGSVVLDDAWGIVLFTMLASATEAFLGTGHPLAELGYGLWRTLGGVLLGIAVAFPMAWIGSRINRGDPSLVLSAGFVLLCSGTATVIGSSYLLASLFLGLTLARISGRARHSFQALEKVAEPFLVVFFVLAGFRFQVDSLAAIGLIGAGYLLFRAAGKVVGASAGAILSGAPRGVRWRIGWCLFPQAGIAVGLALLAQEQFPEFADFLLTPVLATAVIFETVGPLLSRHQVDQAGERQSDRSSNPSPPPSD